MTDDAPVLVEPPDVLASTGYLLARVGTESRRRWARTLTDQSLTPHHYSALLALAQVGAMSQQQLSRMVGVDPRNAVPVIDQLQSRGVIERRPDPDDRRRYAVTLTPAGRSLVTELRDAADQSEEQLLSPLSERDRRTLHRILVVLFDSAIADRYDS